MFRSARSAERSLPCDAKADAAREAEKAEVPTWARLLRTIDRIAPSGALS
jgi:hypothetical protein